jgi:hypothetical protein
VVARTGPRAARSWPAWRRSIIACAGAAAPRVMCHVPCWKRRAEVDRGWMRRVIGWSTRGSQNSALDMHVELAASMPGVFCVAKLECCALRLAYARVRVEGPFDDGMLAQALRT